MKKAITVMLIAMLMTTLLYGCSGSNGNSKNAGSDSNSNTNTASNTGGNKGSTNQASQPQQEEPSVPTYWVEEPTTLKMMAYNHPSWPFNPEWPILDWHKENTNVAVEGFEYAGEFVDAIALTIASGETPDIIQFTGQELAMQYGQMGALVNLNEHMDKLPNLKNYLDTHPTEKAIGTSPDGALYSAITSGLSVISVRNWMYREDVFNKHNLALPTNWEELYQVSKELKKLYPESYPFTFRGKLDQFYTIAPSFNTWYSYYPDPATGEVKYGPVTDEYKELVTWMKKFYEEELIAPDWLSMGTSAWAEYHTTNKAFITVDYALRIPYLNQRVEEGQNYAQMAPPLGHKDGGIANGNISTVGNAIFTTTKNLDASLKYLDYLYSEAGQLTGSWGREGVTYKVDGNGNKAFIAENFTDGIISFDALRNQFGSGTNGLYGWFDGEAGLATYNDEEKQLYADAAQWNWDEEPIVAPNFTEEENEVLTTIGESISKHHEESIAKFIIGERPMDQWDAYIKEMEGLGLQQVMDIYQEGWNRSK